MPNMSDAEELLREARRRSAFVNGHGGDVAAIRHHAGRGMSRRRLEQIYGRELVQAAFSGG